jgi:hypothetical protein
MLISPPFLIERKTNETDASWMDRSMRESSAGKYPIGTNLCWHCGVHLSGRDEVSAIADGTVLVVRPARAVEPKADPKTEPLAYQNWTNDGHVVIRHTLDIGLAANNAPVQITYYSIYQHLREIPDEIKAGAGISRKTKLGKAGYINGASDQFHFEIACDKANLKKLLGRDTGLLRVDQDGRPDAVYGEIYIRLPAGTPVYKLSSRQSLLDANPVATTVTGNNPATATKLTATAVTGQDYYIGLKYDTESGTDALTITTYDETGEIRGTQRTEDENLRNLHVRSKTIAEAYPEASRPNVGSVFELLRFGRVIHTLGGLTPALKPHDVPHWRQVVIPIPTPGGGTNQVTTVWVNLNNQDKAAGKVSVFSDADCPHWRGWRIYDQDRNGDSFCDSSALHELLDANKDKTLSVVERQGWVRNEAMVKGMRTAVCFMPSEWNAATLETRWAWLKKGSGKTDLPEDEKRGKDDFNLFMTHVKALCFDNAEVFQAECFFHPRGFIEHFLKNEWRTHYQIKLGENRVLTPLAIPDFAEHINNATTKNKDTVDFNLVNSGRPADVLLIEVLDGTNLVYKGAAHAPLKGDNVWQWDGYGSEGAYADILDTGVLKSKQLSLRLTTFKGSGKRVYEKVLTLKNKAEKVTWVDAKINRAVKTVEITVRPSFSDGGTEGTPPQGYTPKTHAQLEASAVNGINKYWTRDGSRPGNIGSPIQTAKGAFAVTVTATANVEPKAGNFRLIELYKAHKDLGNMDRSTSLWPLRKIYRLSLLWPAASTGADIDFENTAAHEFGHLILNEYAAGSSPDYSWSHKGSSTVVSQETLPHSQYPLTGEIDVMKYYNPPRPVDYYARSVVAEEDVKGLLWLARVKFDD